MVTGNLRFTAAEFAEILGNGRTMKVGDRGAAVEVLQTTLADLGFPMRTLAGDIGVSSVDGVFGRQTHIALKNFQVHARLSFHGVSVTGELDSVTLTALTQLAPQPGLKTWEPQQPRHAPEPMWQEGSVRIRLRIVVAKDQHRAFLYDDGGRCTGIFPNAHGSSAAGTDPGLKRIMTKLGEREARETGRRLWNQERAFGVRILDLSWATGQSSGEELHGTFDYANMGLDVSHGCVRHYNEDIVAIFDAAHLGDHVAIVNTIADAHLARA